MPTPLAPFARRAGLLAGLLGALAVALGAFGAHALRDALTPKHLAWWQTAADYQLLHACFLLGLAVAARSEAGRLLRVAFWLGLGGVTVFSGTLYAMALTDVRALGAVTPLGGSALITAWVLVAVALWRGHSRGPSEEAS